MDTPDISLESDPRFPSGRWTCYFLQRPLPGRQMMELRLTFREGVMQGEGRDRVGVFLIRGRYNVVDGRCYWTKRYLDKHDVFYKGFNEGKGIWGTWEIPTEFRGGFHIWPEGTSSPSDEHLSAALELPLPVEEKIAEYETVGAPG